MLSRHTVSRLSQISRQSCHSIAAVRFLASMAGPVQQAIESKLTEALKPTELRVLNESYMHAVPKNSETHFKVVVVSPMFDGQKLIARHRMVNQVLADELANGVHALSITAKTPAEGLGKISPSPKCLCV